MVKSGEVKGESLFPTLYNEAALVVSFKRRVERKKNRFVMLTGGE